jgi:hypothetical protein
MRIVSMSTFRVFGRVGLHARVLLLLLAAGEGVANLVDCFLYGPFELVDAPLVLEVSVSGQRADCFLHATFCLIGVLVGHGRPWLVEDGGGFGSSGET